MRRALVLLAIGALACGKSDEQKAAEAAAAQLAELGKAIGTSAAASGVAGADAAVAGTAALMAGKATDAVDFRELKALLPEELDHMKRTSANGEKNGSMGFTMSNAEGEYQTEDGNMSIRIQISDIGAMTGAAAMAAFAWATMTVDRESGESYEKSTEVKGFRALEKYDRANKSGELSVLVAGRFSVEVSGNQVTMDAIKGAFDKIDLGKLDGMKNFGIKN